jgi:hypothetical protein
MRSGPPDEVLSGSCSWSCTVSSSLGGVLLSSSIPLARGRVTATVGQAVPERLTLTVPRFTPDIDWRPGSDSSHPLARYGQELTVTITVGSSVSSDSWDTRIGRFLITDWDDDDEGNISVTGAGLLRRVQDDKLTAPIQPRVGGTLVSEARRLLPLGVSATFDAALVDRGCPASMSWSEDRLDALQEIADAWPALLRTDAWGQVWFKAPLPAVPTPVLTLTDGARGTVMTVPRGDTRTSAFNRVVARSSAVGTEDVQAVVDQSSGPLSTTGPYGVVTKVWSSPLLGSVGTAYAAGATMLANNLRPAQTLAVTHAPDPRIDLDDPVSVIRDGLPTWGWVLGYDLPLTVADGAMRTDVGVAA